MGDSISIKAKKRDLKNDKPNVIRAEGLTPAVIHNHGKDSVHVSVDTKELKQVYSKAGKHAPVDLDVEGKKFTALIRDFEYKPATSVVYHTVFQAVRANEKVSAEVPLKLSENIPAEQASLLVIKGMDVVQIEALPKDLIDVVEVDASSLEKEGDKLHVSDISVPSGVTITSDSEALVASVEVPRDQIAEADAALEEMAEQEDKVASDNAEESADSDEGSEDSGSSEKAE